MSQQNVGDLYVALAYNDATAAIDFLCRAFGFSKRLVVPGPDGQVIHSELTQGGTVVMVSSPKPDLNRISPAGLPGCGHTVCLRVDDPDAHYAVAKSAGAKITQDLKDEDYGSRGYMASDPEGHLWYFGTYRPGEHWE